MNAQQHLLFNLDGQVAVVTGALGRLGPVWIEALLAAGARVAALDHTGAKLSAGYATQPAQSGEAQLRFYHSAVRGGVLVGQEAVVIQKFCARVLFGRMAESRDLMWALVFLASRAASYVTGFEL